MEKGPTKNFLLFIGKEARGTQTTEIQQNKDLVSRMKKLQKLFKKMSRLKFAVLFKRLELENKIFTYSSSFHSWLSVADTNIPRFRGKFGFVEKFLNDHNFVILHSVINVIFIDPFPFCVSELTAVNWNASGSNSSPGWFKVPKGVLLESYRRECRFCRQNSGVFSGSFDAGRVPIRVYFDVCFTKRTLKLCKS